MDNSKVSKVKTAGILSSRDSESLPSTAEGKLEGVAE